jgi:hypothetical protein
MAGKLAFRYHLRDNNPPPKQLSLEDFLVMTLKDSFSDDTQRQLRMVRMMSSNLHQPEQA